MDIHREIADKYQGLFNIMSKEYNLILTISEMDEIIIEAQKVVNKISSKPVLCDSGRSEKLKCGNQNPPCAPNLKFGMLECCECNWSE